MMKNLATLMGIVALLLCACSKEDKKMLITGKIITDCKGTPLANYSLRLSVVYSTWSSPKNIEYFPFTTDENGNFSVVSTQEGSGKIQTGNNYDFLTSIPIRKDINLGTFYDVPTTTFVYRIKINNSYQEGDTLHLEVKSTFSRNFMVIPAPLKDSLFTLSTFSDLNTYNSASLPVSDMMSIKIGKTIFHDNINVASNWYVDESHTITSPICNTTIDTLTIEIN